MFNKKLIEIVFKGLLILVLFSACTARSETPSPTVIVTETPIPEVTEMIVLHYHERPPYMETTATGVSGLTATPASRAFEKAGIPFRWELTPSNRQLKVVQDNLGYDCLLGWFKNPERETFAHFTAPIYQDEPMVALARGGINIVSGGSVGELLSNSEFILMVKSGYSYGGFLDDKIATYAPIKTETTSENVTMLQMLYHERADYFFIAPEEVAPLVTATGYTSDDYKIIQFSDTPPGNNRHIMCSFLVEESVIERLNAALQP